jgi:arylsulfatase A-like enzyme
VIIEDFFTTILKIAGVNNPQQIGGVIDGVSFIPLLKGSTGEFKKRPLIWHYPNRWGPRGPGISYASAMRQGKWKFIFFHDKNRKEGQFELYNLEEDIEENNNLLTKYPEMAAAMYKEFKRRIVEMKGQLPMESGKEINFPELGQK